MLLENFLYTTMYITQRNLCFWVEFYGTFKDRLHVKTNGISI